MNNKKMVNFFLGSKCETTVSCLIMFLPGISLAETVEKKGLTIAIEADNRDLGFGDSTADMLMTLSNKHGQESTREIRTKTLEVKNDGDKSISIFDTPRDVDE